MKKLDPDFIKWLLEWTSAALIVVLVIWWVWAKLLAPSHTIPPSWEKLRVPEIK